MSVKDDGKSCHDCRQLRIERKAHRIMPSGAAVCEEHWRSRMGLPQRTSEAIAIVKSWTAPKVITDKLKADGLSVGEIASALENLGFSKKEVAHAVGERNQAEETMHMAKKPDQSTIDAIQADATAGMKTNQIAEKHGVAWETARKYSAEGGGKTVAKPKAKTNGHAAASGSSCSMTLTVPLADAIWATLSIEKKSSLLQRLE